MVKEFLAAYSCRKDAHRELHFRDHVRLGKYSLAARCYARLKKPPCRVSDNDPRKEVNIPDRLSVPGYAENEPVRNDLYRRGKKVPGKAEPWIPHIGKELIFCYAIDPVKIAEIFLKDVSDAGYHFSLKQSRALKRLFYLPFILTLPKLYIKFEIKARHLSCFKKYAAHVGQLTCVYYKIFSDL